MMFTASYSFVSQVVSESPSIEACQPVGQTERKQDESDREIKLAQARDRAERRRRGDEGVRRCE